MAAARLLYHSTLPAPLSPERLNKLSAVSRHGEDGYRTTRKQTFGVHDDQVYGSPRLLETHDISLLNHQVKDYRSFLRFF